MKKNKSSRIAKRSFSDTLDHDEEDPDRAEDDTPVSDHDEIQDSDDDDDDDDDDDNNNNNNNNDSDEEEESTSESEDEVDVTAVFKGVNVAQEQDDEDSDEASSSDANEEDEEDLAARNKVSGTENCSFDLRNLMAMNSHQIPSNQLYTTKPPKLDADISIPLDNGHGLNVNEGFLLSKSSSACAQLLHALWQLPTEKSDAGPLVNLPAYDEIRIPRALPPPPPKEETKWEKFAKAKGIPLNKEKRSRKVWDEATGTWMFRHGFEKANSKSKEWPIMEVGANDDPYQDPWEKMRDAKRARTEKNLESRLQNQEKAGNLPKGTTRRVVKNREQSRTVGKLGGNIDRDIVKPPSGVPVDLKSATAEARKRGKTSTLSALAAVQRSTASLGKFDQMREGEPERRKALSKLTKRKVPSATDKQYTVSEKEKSMKILNAVIIGGGVAKERAIRKGKLAKGETAYDYEYNDGLGAGTFKKKKGRAAAGKMRKMTKKRAK